MSNKILMHTHTFRTYTAEEALEAAARWGYDGVELLIYRHYGLDGLVKKKDHIAKLLKRLKISIDAIHMSVPSASRNVDERKEFMSKFKAAIGTFKDLGVSILNASAGARASKDSTEEDYKVVSEFFSEIGDYLKNEDLTMTLETHMGSLCDTARSALKIIKLIENPKIKINWDPGNMYATEGAEKTEEAFQMIKDYIGHMHIKNCKKIAGQYVWSFSVEDGDLDYNKIFSMLKSIKYSGLLSIEYSGLGDPNVIARKDIKYVKELRERILLRP